VTFGPGPAAIPAPALDACQRAVGELGETGLSILEHSHRGPAYGAIHDEALDRTRRVLRVPDTHEILFLQGGARTQFAHVPLNLRPPEASADYVVTGTWGTQALAEAQVLGRARLAATTAEDTPPNTRIPGSAELDLDPDAAYLHLTTNNTLFGTQWHELPTPPDGVPLVADATSDLGGRHLDLDRFGLVYAAAQKNLGIAGLTLVILRRDLADRVPDTVPKIFRYRTAIDARSLQNTLPTFAVFALNEVLRWVEGQGGLDAVEAINREKAATLYAALDVDADLYELPVRHDARSIANVVFRLPDDERTQSFLDGAAEQGMVGLAGHRSVGGIRASLYNGVPLGAAQRLAAYISEFADRHRRR